MARRKRYQDPEEGCCGISCLKYVLFIFNFFLWLAGAGVLAVCILTVIEKTNYLAVLATATFAATVYILLITGVAIIIVGTIGCCGAVQEQKLCLVLYFSLLMILFLLELIAGIMAYVYQHQIEQELESQLNSTIVPNYGIDGNAQFTSAVDNLHQNFKCCGSASYQDWRYSQWKVTGLAGNNSAPDSCCKTVSQHCALSDHPSNIYHQGCVKGLENFLGESLVILGAVGIGVACLQVLGIVFSILLYRHLKDEDF